MRKFSVALLLLPLLCQAAVVPGTPRDSNTGNTGGYDGTRIEAQLVVPVEKETEVIHFIRDNNDPRVVTKTYLLQNVDPYEFRDYLRQMVQSKRVGNSSLQQQYPGNTTGNLPTATVSSPALAPAQAQPGFNPAVQLGSNTAVECLKYADGTGLLIVSAEEYRFKDHPNGMGIDTLVAMLDKPGMGALSTGSQMFIYMPKFVPARNLMPLIQNMGMNISDVTELWQGQDLVTSDPDLNWLIFDVSNYSCENIGKMLALYDVPIPQVRMEISIYEISDENDRKLGIDFQNWKNNEGIDFFSGGGRYRNNWSVAFSPGMPSRGIGSERTSFYNFNPKWNTRYLDFLASVGKANVSHAGTLVIRNQCNASLKRTSHVMYINKTAAPPNQNTVDGGLAFYQLLSAITGTDSSTGAGLPVFRDSQAESSVSTISFGFTMDIKNVSVNLNETRFDAELSCTNLLGFQSDGSPRISDGGKIVQTVSLPHGTDTFIIGGLKKQSTVKSRTGIPFLMDIPYLGYLFSTENTSVKQSQLIVTGRCSWDSPSDKLFTPMTKTMTK